MLEDLTIKDFALIDSDYIEFKKGFTVLSGETGAGKSILIGAISFLLGGKSDVGQIRAGKNEANVSATFLLNEPPVSKEAQAAIQADEEYEPKSALEWLFMQSRTARSWHRRGRIPSGRRRPTRTSI